MDTQPTATRTRTARKGSEFAPHRRIVAAEWFSTAFAFDVRFFTVSPLGP